MLSQEFEDLKKRYLIKNKKKKPKNKKKNKKKNIIIPKKHSDTVMFPSAEIFPTDDIMTPCNKCLSDYRFGKGVICKKKFTKNIEKIHNEGYNCAQFTIMTVLWNKEGFDDFDDIDITNCKNYIIKNNMEIWVQCPNFINLARKCCTSSQYVRDKVLNDIERSIQFGATGYIIDVGKRYSKEGISTIYRLEYNFKHAIELIIEELIKRKYNTIPWILIKTSNGSGSSHPVTIEDLSKFYYSIDEQYRKFIGFCINTCNIFVSGECDVSNTDNIDAYIHRWNMHIGWDKVKVVQLFDSEYQFGSKKGNPVPFDNDDTLLNIGIRALRYFGEFAIATGKTVIF